MEYMTLGRNGQSSIEDDDDDARFAAGREYSRGVERGQLSGGERDRERWVERELARPGSIAAHLARTPVSRGVSFDDRAALARVFGTAPPAAAPPRRRDVATVERRGPRSNAELVSSLEDLT